MKFWTKTSSPIILLCAAAACFAAFVPSAGAESLRQIQAIKMPGIKTRMAHLGFDSKRDRVWVAAVGENRVNVIDLQEGKPVHAINDLQEPRDVVYVPDLDVMVIACWNEKKCRFYNPATYELLRVSDPTEDFLELQYDAKTKRLFAAYGRGGISIMDPATGLQIADIFMNEHPEQFELQANSSRLFVNLPRIVSVGVVDTQTRQLQTQWKLPEEGNFAMALDDEHHRLFIAMQVPANLIVVNTDNGKVVATARMLNQCNDIFYDRTTRRIYASCGAGTIDVFAQTSPDNYQLVDRVPTATGARTSLLVSDKRRFFVAVPAQALETAELRVYEVLDSNQSGDAPATTQQNASDKSGSK